jgi:ATP-dependent protease ClpP protease subunit
MTHYRLGFNGSLYEKQANALRGRIAQIFEQRDYESLIILFSSEGGSTDQGLSLYNFFRELPRPIHLHAVGHVGSIAVPAFLGGHKRTCVPYSRFFFHAYDWGFEGRQMSDRIAEALKRLNSDIELSRQIAEKHTTIPAERIAELYGTAPTPTILTPDEAKNCGIVDDIIELNPAGTPQPNVAIWTVGWT